MKEFKIGLLTVSMGILLFVGFNFLKGIDVFSKEYDYYVLYREVPGLLESNAVKINGFKVGTVRNIELIPEKGNQVQVTLSISKDIKLPKNTKAYLADNGLLGEKMIDLKVEKPVKEIIEPEGVIEGAVAAGMIDGLQKAAEPLAESLKMTLDSLQDVMSIYKQTGISAKVTLDRLTLLVAQNQLVLNQTLNNIQGLTSSLNQSLPALANKMNSFADSLNKMEMVQTMADANKMIGELNQTLNAINDAEGTVGQLIKNDELHGEMVQTMKDLDALLIDFKEHPKRYVHFSVFGRKDKAPKDTSSDSNTKDSVAQKESLKTPNK